MTKTRIAVLTVVGLVLLAVPAAIWYQKHYAMAVANSFEAGNAASPTHVLIATQGSRYKDGLVAGIVAHLEPRACYIKAIDVSALPAVREQDWQAIIVIHTWEQWQPQADARAFIERVTDRNKLVVVTTSGSGTAKMPGVDAITAASVMSETPMQLRDITARLDKILSAVEHRSPH